MLNPVELKRATAKTLIENIYFKNERATVKKYKDINH